MNKLELRYDITDERITLRPCVDGVDMLASYENNQGRDPDDLLPPLSSQLLPVSIGHSTLLGVCSCGESGCGSLIVSIRRDQSEVLWEPAESAGQETLNRSYLFELTGYLDAIDRAAGEPPFGEGRGRRVARIVRLQLGMYDQRYESMTVFHRARIDWITAWPWTSDVVRASVTTAGEQLVLEFGSQLDEDDVQFARRVAAQLARLRTSE